MDPGSNWPRFLNRCLIASLAFHVLAAIFSYGFQNSDEHFQILEFLYQRLGLAPGPLDPNQLPVEFHRQLRHWLQPVLYAGPILALRGVGVESPFAWALSARLLSALLGWGSIVAISRRLGDWFPEVERRKQALLCLCFAWFMAALHARHSSESLSATLILTAAALAIPAAKEARASAAFLCGLLTGLSFTARYGLAFMVLGMAGWLLVNAPKGAARARVFALFIAGGAASLAVTLLLDRWGYGEWTYPAWHYFAFHAFEGNAVAAGVSPWWDYFRRVWTESWPVLSFSLLAASMLSWLWFPRHLLTWLTLPFFVGHVLLGHKETRFLYPLAPLAAIQCALTLPRLKAALPSAVAGFLVRSIVALNLICLPLITLTPAWMPIRFFREVHARARSGEIERLWVADRDPYDVLGIRMNFYRPYALRVVRLSLEAEERPRAADAPIWFAHPRPLSEESASASGCELVARTIPAFLPRMGANDWTLYRCLRLPSSLE